MKNNNIKYCENLFNYKRLITREVKIVDIADF